MDNVNLLQSHGAILHSFQQRQALNDIAKLTPIQPLKWLWLDQYDIQIFVKRDDLLDPFVSGNKLYKLWGHYQQYCQGPYAGLATFGGAYSNHLYAVAAFCRALNIPCAGFVGGYPGATPSATLQDLTAMGMQLHYLNRKDYNAFKHHSVPHPLNAGVNHYYWIPEGGSGLLGALGCALWAQQMLLNTTLAFDAVVLAIGTGTTAAGVAAVTEKPLYIVSALKMPDTQKIELIQALNHLTQQVQRHPFIQSHTLPNIHLQTQYHCGGFAKYPPALNEFVHQFTQDTQIPLDPVYTSKVFWAINQGIQQHLWPRGTRLLVLHTGGLQGCRGRVD